MSGQELSVKVREDGKITINQTYVTNRENGSVRMVEMNYSFTMDEAKELIAMLEEAIEIVEEDEDQPSPSLFDTALAKFTPAFMENYIFRRNLL